MSRFFRSTRGERQQRPEPVLRSRGPRVSGMHQHHPPGLDTLADMRTRARTWSDEARSSGAISGDGGPVVTTERAFVTDHIGLRLAARARHHELRDGGHLRRHGAETQHRAAAGRMSIAGLVLVVLAISGHSHVMRMRRRSGISLIVLMVVRMRGLIGRMLAGNPCIGRHRDRKGRRHRRKQIGDDDKPSPPPSPWLSQANHLCIR